MCVLIHTNTHGVVTVSKKRTNVSLDPSVYKKAKKLGINISQTAEEALQIRIESSKQSSSPDETPPPLGLTLAQIDSVVPGATATQQLDAEEFLSDFEQRCIVDWEYAESTTRERMRYARKLVNYLDGHPLTASKQDLRGFIKQYNDTNITKTVRVIYGRYFETDIADSFSIPQSIPKPSKSPKKTELQNIYQELPSDELKVAFLILATSGLRRRELMELTPSEIELGDRAIYPQTEDGHATKRQWVTFYSEDTDSKLREVFDISNMTSDEPLFSWHPDTLTNRIGDASKAAGTMKVTPQVLRVWFCQELSQLGVTDRHIDAMCGRASRSVLARHYSDFSPENLQSIYEDAGISVLE